MLLPSICYLKSFKEAPPKGGASDLLFITYISNPAQLPVQDEHIPKQVELQFPVHPEPQPVQVSKQPPVQPVHIFVHPVHTPSQPP